MNPRLRVGLRGALKYYDGNGRIQNVLSTSTDVVPPDLPRLSTEPEQSLADGLLKENGDIRRLYHERITALKEEVRTLRRLRGVGGWLGFQARRLSPSRVAAALRRRRGTRAG